uniref:G_PROTEIN_RECEP_F1_2 domain-containing protein n=1 Tax=Angiostrongylus cantonensis TaxID=6313 RepID=A0A0K0DFY3_ANGCA
LKNHFQKSSRLLVILLTITDLLHAVTSKSFCLTLEYSKRGPLRFSALPYTIHLVISWDPFDFNLNPHFVIISTVPVIIQLKINLTLTILISVERTLAIYFPAVFRILPSHSYALYSLSSGFLLAILDHALEVSLTPFNHAPNYLSVGCFLADSFAIIGESATR